MQNRPLVQLFFYVPESALEQVKAELFAAGAGRIGDYSDCCWQVIGQGQYRPLQGSNPHIGKLNELSRESEYRVEMVLYRDCMAKVKQALIESHPYEEVAYGFIDLMN